MEAFLLTLKSYLILLGLHSSRYIFIAIGSFLLIKKYSVWAEKRKIQKVLLKDEDIKRELKYSFYTILLNGLFLVTAFHPSVMPHTKIFKHVHRVHHFSTNPSCLASQAFHPIEAFFQVVFTYPVVFILPVHPTVLVAFGGMSFLYNVYGHMNVELIPGSLRKHWLFRWCGTATIHNAHHKQFNGNYGLYFRFWDKLMKTDIEQ